MVDPQAAGIVGEPFEMVVETGKVREFARAVWSASAAYLSADDPVMPPTFLAIASFWQQAASDPWPAVRMDQRRGLHAEQEFVFHGPPPRAGTRLTGVSRIDSVTTKQGRRGGELTFAVMVTEFRDAGGRLVAESRLTGVETEHMPAGSGASS